MRKEAPKELNGTMIKTSGEWHNAAYIVKGPMNKELKILCSNGYDWEHVSVSCANRTPNWIEMSFVKNLFWDEDEMVIQYHPSKADYVNAHPNCLHMWKPLKGSVPKPPRWMVGPYEGWEKDCPKELLRIG